MNPSRSIPRSAVGLSIVLLTLIAMLAITWRTWPEPVTDFGRELYVPWQLSQGKVLYRDIAYFNGPLSPYFNALIFKLLGPGLMKLAGVNIAILIVIELMLYRLAAKMSDDFAATVACCAFTMLLAVGQPGPVGNYNFITPYSHEMTHGMALSLGTILCLARYIKSSKRVWICACGALVGLAFLTKPEIVAAVSIAIVAGLVLGCRREKQWADLICFAACGSAIVLIATGLLMLALPFREAASDVFGAWGSVVDSRVTHLPFYQRVRGTFDLAETFRLLPLMTLGYAIAFGLPLLIARFIPRDRARSAWRFTSSLGVFAAILLFFRDQTQWEEAGRPIVFVSMACAAMFLKGAIRNSEAITILRATFALFALILMAKILFRVQLYHYGFALAAPGLIVLVMLVCGWLPSWIESQGGSSWIMRGGSVAVIAITCGVYVLMFGQIQIRRKPVLVSTGSDAFWSRPQGITVNEAVAHLRSVPRDATVAVMPEGAMINYLARRPNPTPYIVLMPPEVIMFGQERIIDSFNLHPPDYIVLMKPDVSEYGSAGFDVDYGRAIYEWVMANYRATDAGFSDTNVRMLERISPAK